jgi:monoamine oxidase
MRSCSRGETEMPLTLMEAASLRRTIEKLRPTTEQEHRSMQATSRRNEKTPRQRAAEQASDAQWDDESDSRVRRDEATSYERSRKMHDCGYGLLKGLAPDPATFAKMYKHDARFRSLANLHFEKRREQLQKLGGHAGGFRFTPQQATRTRLPPAWVRLMVTAARTSSAPTTASSTTGRNGRKA